MPCHKIDAVLIFGNVQFTTQAIAELFEQGIEFAIFSKTGKLKGQITSVTPKNILLRVQQFKKYWDDDFKLEFSKIILTGKITNAVNLIKRFSLNHKDIDFEYEKTSLSTSLKKINSLESIKNLFGVEGNAAKIYFSALSKMMLSEFEFNGRNKRPPKDPVNALLSLTYTMIYNDISSMLDGLGFDPYLGYFHHVDYGRASLAADILEEFRAPSGDRLVLKLLNNRILKKEDFYTNTMNNGCYLKTDALKLYFKEYENMVNTEFIDTEKNKTSLRKCFRSQAEKLALTIKDNTVYKPFVFKT